MENYKLIDFIINQYEQIQGELMIQEVFANEVDEKIAELVDAKKTNLSSLLSELSCYQELAKQKIDLLHRLEYLRGMSEAYHNIIHEIKKEE